MKIKNLLPILFLLLALPAFAQGRIWFGQPEYHVYPDQYNDLSVIHFYSDLPYSSLSYRFEAPEGVENPGEVSINHEDIYEYPGSGFEIGMLRMYGHKEGPVRLVIYHEPSGISASTLIFVAKGQPAEAIAFAEPKYHMTPKLPGIIKPYVYPAHVDFNSLALAAEVSDGIGTLNVSPINGLWPNYGWGVELYSSYYDSDKSDNTNITLSSDRASGSCTVVTSGFGPTMTRIQAGILRKGYQTSVIPYFNGDVTDLEISQSQWNSQTSSYFKILAQGSEYCVLGGYSVGTSTLYYSITGYERMGNDITVKRNLTSKAVWEVVDTKSCDDIQSLAVASRELTLEAGQFANLRVDCTHPNTTAPDGAWYMDYRAQKFDLHIDDPTIVDRAYPNGVIYARKAGRTIVHVKSADLEIPVTVTVTGGQSGVDTPAIANPPSLTRCFNLNGQPVDESYRGFIIEQYSDGTTRKRIRR